MAERRNRGVPPARATRTEWMGLTSLLVLLACACGDDGGATDDSTLGDPSGSDDEASGTNASGTNASGTNGADDYTQTCLLHETVTLERVELAREEGTDFWDRLRVDETHAYFVEGSSLMRVAREGGPVETVVSRDSRIEDFALADGDVYLVGDDGLFAVPKAGGDTVRLAPIARLARLPGRLLAVDDEAVYVAEQISSDELGQVISVPRAGGEVSVLLDGLQNPREIAVDADFVYVGTVPENSFGEAPDGELHRVSKSGGEGQLLASINLDSMRVDEGGFVYGLQGAYAAVSPKALFRVPKAGGAPERLDPEVCELSTAYLDLVDGQLMYGSDSVFVADADGNVQMEYLGLNGLGSTVTAQSRAFQGGVFFEIRDSRRLLAFPQP